MQITKRNMLKDPLFVQVDQVHQDLQVQLVSLDFRAYKEVLDHSDHRVHKVGQELLDHWVDQEVLAQWVHLVHKDFLVHKELQVVLEALVSPDHPDHKDPQDLQVQPVSQEGPVFPVTQALRVHKDSLDHKVLHIILK